MDSAPLLLGPPLEHVALGSMTAAGVTVLQDCQRVAGVDLAGVVDPHLFPDPVAGLPVVGGDMAVTVASTALAVGKMSMKKRK